MLVQQHGDHRDDNALENIEGHHGEQHQRGDAGNGSVDIGTHGNDGIQRQAVKLGEFRQQINGIECTAEDGHTQGTDHQTDDGGLLALFDVIDDGCGQHHGAADRKVGKVADEGSGGSLQQELENDLQKFANDTGYRPQIEGADQYGNFTEVDLIERRRKEQGEFQKHQHSGDGTKHGDKSNGFCRGQPLRPFDQQLIRQPGQSGQGGKDKDTDEQACLHSCLHLMTTT